MTTPPDDTLRRQLNTPDVAERDAAFTVNLLDKVRRDRRRSVAISFAWTAILTALVGLLAAGVWLGGLQAVHRAVAAVSGG